MCAEPPARAEAPANRLSRADVGMLALLLALTAIKGVLWGIAVPLWQGPDENRHFATVQFIAEHGRLPGPEEVYRDDENVIVGELADAARLWYAPEQRQAFSDGADGPREAEIAALDPALRTSTARGALNIANHLAPLSYLLGALAYRLAYGGTLIARLFAVRMASVACAVGTVGCAFFLAREAFPRQRAMWLTVPLLVSFQPMFTFVNAVVNSDAPLILCYTIVLWMAVRAAARGWGVWEAVIAGIALGLGMLTKPMIGGAVPVLVLAALWDGWSRGPEGIARWAWARWRPTFGKLALSGAVALLACGWWLWRSVRLFGALLYANPIQLGVMSVEHPYYGYTLPRYAWHYLQSLVGGVFVTYWADFGWIDTPLSPWIYQVLLGVCALAAVGAAVSVWAAWRKPGDHAQAAALGVLWSSVPLLVAMLGYNTFRTWVTDGIGWGGMQGRYYLGPVVAAMAGLAWGVLSLLPARWRPGAHVALRWGAFLLHAVSLWGALLPRYYL